MESDVRLDPLLSGGQRSAPLGLPVYGAPEPAPRSLAMEQGHRRDALPLLLTLLLVFLSPLLYDLGRWLQAG